MVAAPALHKMSALPAGDASASSGNAESADESVGNEAAINEQRLAEARELLTQVYEASGFDFRDYAMASLCRRIQRSVQDEGVIGIPELRKLIAVDATAMNRLLNSLTLPVTSMFRDPSFFKAFREQVCPALATYPFLRLWVAGCSTGQEAYSLAILLREAGLYDRSRIYATDLHPGSLQQARAGIYPLSVMREYTQHYQAAGGALAFTEYYTADAEYALLDPSLGRNIVFAAHNLVSDGSFNEFHAVLCRNVMIYFNEKLQARVHGLLYESLGMLGYLCLGRSESIRFSVHETNYEPISRTERIYRKTR